MRLAILVYIAFFVCLFTGWVMNLIEVVHLATSGAVVNAMFITRIVGVPIAVLGGILGWL